MDRRQGNVDGLRESATCPDAPTPDARTKPISRQLSHAQRGGNKRCVNQKTQVFLNAIFSSLREMFSLNVWE